MEVIFAIFLLVFCNLNLLAQSDVTKEEYAVYAGVFESIYAENFKSNEFKTHFVISEDTITVDFIPSGLVNPKSVLDYTNEKISSDLESLSKDFKQRNKYSTKFERHFSIESEYNIITKNEKDKLLEDGKKEYEETIKRCKCLFFSGFWQPFHKKYKNSGGLYNLSKIGFSRDKKLALVFANVESGDQGSSMFYVLEKVEGKWRIQEKIFVNSWIT